MTGIAPCGGLSLNRPDLQPARVMVFLQGHTLQARGETFTNAELAAKILLLLLQHAPAYQRLLPWMRPANLRILKCSNNVLRTMSLFALSNWPNERRRKTHNRNRYIHLIKDDKMLLAFVPRVEGFVLINRSRQAGDNECHSSRKRGNWEGHGLRLRL